MREIIELLHGQQRTLFDGPQKVEWKRVNEPVLTHLWEMLPEAEDRWANPSDEADE